MADAPKTLALALRVSRALVKDWEGLPDRARALADNWMPDASAGVRQGMIKRLEQDWRDILGGEETYLACKKFLEEHDER